MKDQYSTTLRSVGNPDHGQYASPSNSEKILADTVEEIQRDAQLYIQYWSLGGGNWPDMRILKNGKPYGYLSYNGRIYKKRIQSSNDFAVPNLMHELLRYPSEGDREKYEKEKREHSDAAYRRTRHELEQAMRGFVRASWRSLHSDQRIAEDVTNILKYSSNIELFDTRVVGEEEE